MERAVFARPIRFLCEGTGLGQAFLGYVVEVNAIAEGFDAAGEPAQHPGAIAAIGVGTVLTGFIASLRTPAPQPARANILYNRLLREQLARRNADIARENAARRQAVEIRAIPLAGGAR